MTIEKKLNFIHIIYFRPESGLQLIKAHQNNVGDRMDQVKVWRDKSQCLFSL